MDSDVWTGTVEHGMTRSRRAGNAADPFVIGLAGVHGAIVVTEETPSGNLDRPRIPDVCEAMGVPSNNLIGFVRRKGWSF